MDSSGSKKQLHMIFSGRVQGVGFRQTLCQMAKTFSVEGWVRNLDQGTVEAVCEGSHPVLIEFLQAVRSSPLGDLIFTEKLTWASATGKYKTFEVSV